jgi:hypothetical protein
MKKKKSSKLQLSLQLPTTTVRIEEKKRATKRQLSLQPRTQTSKIEKNTSYQASTEPVATNDDFEN